LIASTDSTADVADASVFDFVLPALCVLEVFVAAVEDNVVARQVRCEALEDLVADAAMWE
jgi:hypothetical protein